MMMTMKAKEEEEKNKKGCLFVARAAFAWGGREYYSVLTQEIDPEELFMSVGCFMDSGKPCVCVCYG